MSAPKEVMSDVADRIPEHVKREFENVDGLRVFRVSFRRAELAECTLKICADSLSDVLSVLGSWHKLADGHLRPHEKGLRIEIDDLGSVQSDTF